jgi:hypothetical protein
MGVPIFVRRGVSVSETGTRRLPVYIKILVLMVIVMFTTALSGALAAQR